LDGIYPTVKFFAISPALSELKNQGSPVHVRFSSRNSSITTVAVLVMCEGADRSGR
jgi:hypothetical protein